MRRQEIRLAGDFRAALIGNQRHVMAALIQFCRKGECRDQVPTCPARGQHEMPA
jgi:hypothetical protein